MDGLTLNFFDLSTLRKASESKGPDRSSTVCVRDFITSMFIEPTGTNCAVRI